MHLWPVKVDHGVHDVSSCPLIRTYSVTYSVSVGGMQPCVPAGSKPLLVRQEACSRPFCGCSSAIVSTFLDMPQQKCHAPLTPSCQARTARWNKGVKWELLPSLDILPVQLAPSSGVRPSHCRCSQHEWHCRTQARESASCKYTKSILSRV